MKKKSKAGIESILDINSNNIWSLDESEVADLWETSRHDDELGGSENKLLNVIRLAFDVYHYNPEDPRDVSKYEGNEGYATFKRSKHCDGCVAVHKRAIKRITDITYENIKHLSAKQLLTLIDDNFGGGWDAIPLQIKDIIESGFDISTTTLPSRRLHAPGGTLERKVEDGFDVLEVAKGLWVEAIFVRKKDPLEKVRLQDPSKYDEEGNRIQASDDDDDFNPQEERENGDADDEDDDDETIDETYYGTYIPEADAKSDDEEEDMSV